MVSRMGKVIAYHFIFSAYGFWLPNDPRGSWSDTIRALHLLKHGDATKVTTTDSLAHARHDRNARLRAKEDLLHPPVRFTGEQALAIAQGFEVAQRQHAYRYLGLATMPDHVHLVVEAFPRHVDDIARHLKAKATGRMTELGIHPMAGEASATGRLPSPWCRNHWCPFIRDARHLAAAIRYVEANPIKSRLPRQRWHIVDRATVTHMSSADT